MRLVFILCAFLVNAGAEYNSAKVIAHVDAPHLNESSGVAASRKYPGVFWTHNDSGGGPYIYAFNRAGKSLGRWRVRGATANDWEDIAIGPGPRGGTDYLYIGDIGDNQREHKGSTVYRVAEPDPNKPAEMTDTAADAIRVSYPDEPHDAECLMVHPKTGDIYIVTKARGYDSVTHVYKAAAPHSTNRLAVMREVATLSLPDSSPVTLIIGQVTGGDISPDGTRVVVCDYFSAWEAVVPRGKRFDSVWTGRWTRFSLGSRAQGEGICYRHDGKAVIATSEGERFPLIEVER